MIYDTADCAFYLRVLSVLVPVMYCDMTVDGMLKGLDEQRACMRYNIWDSGLCVALVWALLPRFGLRGYVFILFFSELFNFYFSLRRLSRVSTVEVHLAQDLAMPLCCGVCAPASISLLMRLTGWSETQNAGALTGALVLSTALYTLLLYGFGCVSREDARRFARTCGIGTKVRRPMNAAAL